MFLETIKERRAYKILFLETVAFILLLDARKDIFSDQEIFAGGFASYPEGIFDKILTYVSSDDRRAFIELERSLDFQFSSSLAAKHLGVFVQSIVLENSGFSQSNEFDLRMCNVTLSAFKSRLRAEIKSMVIATQKDFTLTKKKIILAEVLLFIVAQQINPDFSFELLRAYCEIVNVDKGYIEELFELAQHRRQLELELIASSNVV